MGGAKTKSVDIMRCKIVREDVIEYAGRIDRTEDAVEFFKAVGYEEYAEEVAGVLCMDGKGNRVGYHEVSRGDITNTIIHPREVFKRALLNNAYGIIVCHNHPSGDPTPSQEDDAITTRLNDAGRLIGIKLFDHIIIGDSEYYSYREEGML